MHVDRRAEVMHNAAQAVLTAAHDSGYPCGLSGPYGIQARSYPHFSLKIPCNEIELLVWLPESDDHQISVGNLCKMIVLRHPCFSSTRDLHKLEYDHPHPFVRRPSFKKTCRISVVQRRRTIDQTSSEVPLGLLLLQALESWNEKNTADTNIMVQAALKLILDDLSVLPVSNGLYDFEYEHLRRLAVLLYKDATSLKDATDIQVPLIKIGVVSLPIVPGPTFKVSTAQRAAMSAVKTLRKAGYSSVVFGGLACYTYGTSRQPNDVDILVFGSDNSEALKLVIALAEPDHFFLKSSVNPHATYKILFHRIFTITSMQVTCKVDIVTPGTMHLPNLPPSYISTLYALPVLPIHALLLHKLQGWYDNRHSMERFRRMRQGKDVSDLCELVEMVPTCECSIWSDRNLFSADFEEMSRDRVIEFCQCFPDVKGEWERLGFEMQRGR